MNSTTRSQRGTIGRRGRATAALSLIIALMLSGLSLASPADAAVSNNSGAYVDTTMDCLTAGDFGKAISLSATQLQGFDYAAVYTYNTWSRTGQWVTSWMPAQNLHEYGVAAYPNGLTAVLVFYADWTAQGWTFSHDWALRVDGAGYFC